MSVVFCSSCDKAIENCNCLKNFEEDFSRTDIERYSTTETKKQFTVFDLIASVSDLVETTTNDSELGAAVRKLFVQ